MFSLGIVLLLVGACFYIGILYTNPVIVLLGYALGILVLISILELLLRWFTVNCQLEIPIAMAEQDMPVTVQIQVKNMLPLPLRKTAVRMGIRNPLGAVERHQWMTLYDNRMGNTKHTCKIVPKGAGCHEIYVDKIRIYAMSGLFYITKKSRTCSSALILPKIHSVGIHITEAVRNFVGDADVFDDFRPGHDPGETFEIREYREKDRMQSIHWKLTAKTDGLMVKENSLPKACAVVLMLDLQPIKNSISGKGKTLSKTKDAYLELAASLSFSLMDYKCPHFVAWYSREKEDVRRIRVDDEESFYLFLDCFLQELSAHDKDIRQEYREKYKSEWYLHDICLYENLEIHKDGELLHKLNEKKMVDECEKLELLL